jgi:hypothetical protein
MAGFGTIHELASIESRIRRDLLEAKHLMNCVQMSLDDVTDETPFDEDLRASIKRMILEAMEVISRVSGD